MIRTLLAPFIVTAMLTSPSMAADEPGRPIVAVYDLEGIISESGQRQASLMDLQFDTTRPLTLLDITLSLKKAAETPDVKAVVVDADGAELDIAQVQEVRKQLLAVKRAGKDVWIYSEHLTNGTALLGSTANHFTLMPEADCMFHGFQSESMYFKGLMDKVGVAAEVIHIGDYKSFGEMFYRTGPSEESKKQDEKLLDAVFQQVVADVAEGRKLPKEKVKAIIDNADTDAKAMLANGVVDHLMYRTELVEKLREKYGKEAHFDRSFELPDLDGPEIEGMFDLLKLMFSSSDSKRARKDFVAVVALEGDITEQSIAPLRTKLLALAKEEKAKALVLRVNSPGGSALASELLWEATTRWKATGKPFVVSMGGVAASGGYYVSCGADRIFAESGTVTGSIGVVGMKIVVAGAFDKLGITTHTIQRGKNAGLDSMTRGYTADEAEAVRKSMDKVYQTFKKRVTDGRKGALKGDLEPLAGGRVYSGKQALEIGLVDEIGGLSDAIAYVTSKANLTKPDVKLLPEPKSQLEGLFAKPEKKSDDEIIRAPRGAGFTARIDAALMASGLQGVLPEPVRVAAKRLASRLEAFGNARILMVAPDFHLR